MYFVIACNCMYVFVIGFAPFEGEDIWSALSPGETNVHGLHPLPDNPSVLAFLLAAGADLQSCGNWGLQGFISATEPPAPSCTLGIWLALWSP